MGAKKKWRLLLPCLLGLTLSLGALLLYLGGETEQILPGVTVAGVDVGGLTREEAEALLEPLTARYGETTLQLWEGEGLLISVRWAEAGLSPDFSAAAERAWSVGREEEGLLPCLRRGWRRLFPREYPDIAPPVRIDQERLWEALPAAPEDAAYDPVSGEIREGRSGIRLDVPALREALQGAEAGGVVRFPAERVLPEISAEHLRQVLFRDTLGEYATKVGGSAVRRGNVALSAAAIDGTVLLPGEIFDYNAAVGERTVERGYGAAPAYVNGETVAEVGGGICQTSSTLYMAALLSDLEIVERSAHRYVSSYIPAGLDATVSWGGPEFRFRNDTRYPVKVQAKMEGDTLTVTLTGTKVNTTRVQMRSEILSTEPYATRYEDSAALNQGTERVRQSGYTGCTVQTYREVYDAEGNLLSSALEARSVYRKRDKIILRGTAALPEPKTEAHDPMLDAPF